MVAPLEAYDFGSYCLDTHKVGQAIIAGSQLYYEKCPFPDDAIDPRFLHHDERLGDWLDLNDSFASFVGLLTDEGEDPRKWPWAYPD